MKILALIIALNFAPAVMAQQVAVPQTQAQIQLSFAPLVKQVAPAVVNIYARIMAEPERTPLQRDPFFGRLFGDPEALRPKVQNSLGSGVILSGDGIVVSNYHVVGMATDIRVVLSDRREYSAKVLLADDLSDLAILQIEDAPGDLPSLPLRASDGVEVGELALAIGNPFGVGQTVSSGIVSGLARSGADAGTGRGYFIQTDAPINPGNSGGALVDMQGRLIGVNTSILTRSGGSNGIGFAIPADLVAAFVAQARDGETRFGRPWAGMTGQPLDADMAAAFGLDRPGGIIVSGLHAESPFARAGFAVGDVITAVNGQPVNTPSEMVYRMSVTGLGKTAQITRLRDGAASDVGVPLMAAPEEPPRAILQMNNRTLFPGLTLSRVNPGVIAEFNLPLDAAGVLVLDPGALAGRIGLRSGDVITTVNGVTVDDPRRVAQAFDGRIRAFGLTVLRGARQITLQFRV
ncbi:trypsin-like peptidase domain-containing protein [Sulfitobacter sabulilitoris]|uniref:PDZ domain-containing protein n=1 Tax=Sulfitobacter sabulilitoris TaxID=2562655 RepID=A0A5S3P7W8_9RHOB|nr:trypsin-like peptidase domain-containing protein [Sulfitobacter sabulilitoris]TMM49441.1 PDZ domain-containing protein [Sulfitobacter sabulilitoris]